MKVYIYLHRPFNKSLVVYIEQAKKIAYDAVQAVVGNENVVYSKEKVNDWCR